MSKSNYKDCFICKKGEIYYDGEVPCVDCGSKEKQCKNNFAKNGRFCADYCKGYDELNDEEIK